MDSVIQSFPATERTLEQSARLGLAKKAIKYAQKKPGSVNKDGQENQKLTVRLVDIIQYHQKYRLSMDC